jgi:hypothetical protein
MSYSEPININFTITLERCRRTGVLHDRWAARPDDKHIILMGDLLNNKTREYIDKLTAPSGTTGCTAGNLVTGNPSTVSTGSTHAASGVGVCRWLITSTT